MANLSERMIEGQIIRDLFCRRASKDEPVSLLFDIDSLRANRADKTGPCFLPMEDLAGI